MKLKAYQCIGLLVIMSLFTACEKDNYDGPGTSLKGRIIYNNENINVEWNQVRIQLFESGWQLKNPIDVTIAQDGTYSAVLFDGNYKMVIPAKQGPFLTHAGNEALADTIELELRGSRSLDIEVIPYYMIRNSQFARNNTTVNATFALEQIVTDANAKNIEHVNLYLNKSLFVSGANNVASRRINGGDITDLGNIAISADIPALVPSQNYVFARVGVKISGVEDMIFSTVQRIDF